MNWQIPIMLAQSTDLEDLRKRTALGVQQGTTIPDSSLVREGSSNPFTAEYWFPAEASSFAGEVDDLYMAIFWISLVFFVGIIGTMTYFCVKYRRKGGVIAPQPSSSHNTAIEILWSVLPSILLVWMFYTSSATYFKMKNPRPDAEVILVTAKQYDWMFTYPDGDSSPELHLVRDRPVQLKMVSKDVIHSLFIPAFRQKQDVVPGRFTYAYFLPTLLGEYRLSCNEFCGTDHSKMRTMAQVHISEEDRKNNTEWIPGDWKPWQNGEHIFQMQCAGCHRVDGIPATGPALNLIWGTDETMIDGSKIKVDDEYILSSILTPEKDIVKGFGPNTKMTSFKGILSVDTDIMYITEYLKHLKDPNSALQETVDELKKETPDESGPDAPAGDDAN